MDIKGSVNKATLTEEKKEPLPLSPEKPGMNVQEGLHEPLAYWKQRLEGASTVLELPTDRPRPPVQTFTRALQSFVLSQPLSAALKTLSQQEGVSLFVTLLAAFQTMLHRYTGQNDFLVGTPSAGPSRSERADLNDVFGNTLVLRTDVSGNPTFRELLGRVREGVLEAYARQDFPFEQVVEVLQLGRDPSRNPLYQIMFAMENAAVEEMEGCGLASRSRETDSGTVKVDLALSMEDTAQGLTGRVEYNADLFDAATIVRLVGHWQTLLEGIVASPDQRLSELPLLTEAEHHQILVAWNDTAVDYPRDRCIHQFFEAQVERIPDAVALVYENTQLTYRELNRRANQLAHYLQRLGVGVEVLVGLYVERSLEMVVGLLGILKAGGAYVPLDPTYPSERLAFMLADSQASVLLTQERLSAGMSGHGIEVVYLDLGWDRISQESEENPISNVRAENAAYVIYTSGSTGIPKGVVIQHVSLVNYTEVAIVAYSLKPGDRVLQFAPISFDISAEEIYPCLTRGATLVLRTNSMIDSVSLFLQKCQDWSLTMLSLPTAYWHELTRKINVSIFPPSLRLVIIGGERALPELLASWQKYVSQHVQFVNTYGPTEATIAATMHKLSGSTQTGATLREVPIGRPIPNVQVYLLDQYLNAVPIGVPGELHIGGIGLARGYLNRPEQTIEKFIAHPFSGEPGARLYKTGDLARYLPTGDIEFLGRLDHQVKIRGYRIELGEIEAVLGKHPAVQEVMVVDREDVPGDKRLVAYVVTQREHIPTNSELRRVVQERLPDYMVPSAFVLLDRLPQTPNGKLDRRALPAPDRTRAETDATFVAPTLAAHHQLRQIWEELLDVRPIGIRDNFFDLGGHSLLAVRLVDRIEQIWGKKIPSAILLADPTIEHLANFLLQTEDGRPASSLVAVQDGASGQLTPSAKTIRGYLSLAKSRFAGLVKRSGDSPPGKSRGGSDKARSS